MKSSSFYAGVSLAIGALMVGGYALMRPPAEPGAVLPASEQTRTKFDVRIDSTPVASDRELPLLRIAKGDVVSIAVSSDVPGRLMVHGYMEEMMAVEAGQTATIRLVALHAGRYPLHLHGDDQSHREVAVLEIRS